MKKIEYARDRKTGKIFTIENNDGIMMVDNLDFDIINQSLLEDSTKILLEKE